MASPFGIFRTYQKQTLAVLAVFVIVIWGVGDILPRMMNSGGGGGAGAGKARVIADTNFGQFTAQNVGELVNRRSLANRFCEMAARASERGRGHQFGFGRQPSEDAVVGEMFRREATHLGIQVTRDDVNDFINQITNQNLNPSQLKDILKTLHTDQPTLFNVLASELQAERAAMLLFPQPTDFMAAPPSSTPARQWLAYQQLNVKAKIDFVAIPVDAFVGQLPDPNEKELLALFEKSKSKFDMIEEGKFVPGFKQPRKLRLHYAKASLDEFESKVSKSNPVKDEEVVDYYEKNKALKYLDRTPDKTDEPIQPNVSPDDKKTDGDKKPDEKKPEGEKKPDDKKPDEKKTDGDKKPDGDKPTEKKPDGEKKPEDKKPEGDAKPDDSKKPATDEKKPGEEKKPDDKKPADGKPIESKETETKKSSDGDGCLTPQADGEKTPDAKADAKDNKSDAKTDAKGTDAKPTADDKGTDAPKPAPAKTDDKKPEDKKPEDKKPEDKKPEEGDKKPTTETKPNDKKSDEKPDEKKPDEKKPDEKKPDDKKPEGETKPEETKLEAPKLKFKPLDDDLKSEIRELLVKERAQAEITKALKSLAEAINELSLELISKDIPLSKPKPEHFKEIADLSSSKIRKEAEALGLSFATTDLIDGEELSKLPDLGRAKQPGPPDMMGRSSDVKIANFLFGQRILLMTPSDFEDELTGAHFKVWSVEDVKSHVPPWKEAGVQDQVKKMWKRLQAEEKAQARAKELVNLADKAPSLAEAYSAQTVTGVKSGTQLTVQTPPEFSWMYTPATPNPNPFMPSPIELSTVPQAEKAGFDFMELVFRKLEVGETGWAANADRSQFFVVRVTARTEPDRDLFLRELDRTGIGFIKVRSYDQLEQGDQNRINRERMKQLETRYGVKWNETTDDDDES